MPFDGFRLTLPGTFRRPAPAGSLHRTWKLPCVKIGCALLSWGLLGANLRAQELSLLGGASASANLLDESYSWQIDYRQYLLPNLAASAAWINEGHLPDHHPDGLALEGWYCLPLAGDRLSLSVGAGPYLFFDTIFNAGSGSINSHGVAPIFSGSLTGYISDRWFWRFIYNRINPPTNDIKVNTAVFGLGYWIASGHTPADARWAEDRLEAASAPYTPENTVTLYGGWRVLNTQLNRQTLAESLEYRRGLIRYVDATASFIYEGDPNVVRRSGFATQLWAVSEFSEQWGFTVGMGFGAYVFIDQKTPPQFSQEHRGAVGGLVSPMIAKRIGDSAWSVRLIWNRVITDYDRDSDVWMLGLGYTWR